MRIFTGLLIVFFASGCSHLRYPEIPEYKLTRSGPFVVSESPNLWRYFERSFADKKNLEIDVILRNVSDREQTLQLSRSTLKANASVTPVECESATGEKQSLPVKAGVHARIRCRVDLQVTAENQLGMKDTVLQIAVPYGDGAVRVERLIRIEEVQR